MPISPAKVNLVLEAATAFAALDKEDEGKKKALKNAVEDCLADSVHKDASYLSRSSCEERCIRVIAPEDREQIQHLIKELKPLITEPDSENQKLVSEFIANLEHTLNNVAVKVNDAFPIDVDVSKVPYLEAAVNGRWKTSTFNPSDRSICIRTHKEKPAEKRGAEESPSFEEWPFDPDLVRFLFIHLEENKWAWYFEITTSSEVLTPEDRERFEAIAIDLKSDTCLLKVGPELLQIADAFGIDLNSTPLLKDLAATLVRIVINNILFYSDPSELQAHLDKILSITEEYPFLPGLEKLKAGVFFAIAQLIGCGAKIELTPSHLKVLQKLLESNADPSLEILFHGDSSSALQRLMLKDLIHHSSTHPDFVKKQQFFLQFILENCTDKVYERVGAQILSLPPQVALHIAASCGQPTLLRVIIEEGKADINLKIGGSTPLMQAVLSNNPNAVKVLIEAGADLTAVDREGKTAFQIAKENGKAYYAEMIEKAMREQGLS